MRVQGEGTSKDYMRQIARKVQELACSHHLFIVILTSL